MHFETVGLTEISNDDKGKSIAMRFILVHVHVALSRYGLTISLSPSGNSYGRPIQSVNNICAEYKAQGKQNGKINAIYPRTR